MTDATATETTHTHTFDEVTCPFCGLLCDDLSLRVTPAALDITRNGCAKAQRAYGRAARHAQPAVLGKPATLEAALQAATRVLRRARQPLFAGLGTDVEGTRATLALAERCGAIVDHLHGPALTAGTRVLQSRGLTLTTLSEVRNRADLVVLLGANLNDDFARFIDRCLLPAEALDPERLARRRVVHVGPAGERPRHPGLNLEQIPCATADLPQWLMALRAARLGRPGGLKGKAERALKALNEALAAADYAVFVWAPGQLPPTVAELVIGSASALIADLNRERRAAGLTLGGNDGGQSAQGVCGWITGFPLPVSYAGDTLDYDPLRYSTAHLLQAGTVDALLWISTFSDRPPPPTELPCIILGTPGSAGSSSTGIYLPTGIPGIDHAGQMIRTDNVVTLPLSALRTDGAPSAASLLRELQRRLETQP